MADTAEQKSLTVPLTAFAAGGVVALLVGLFGRLHEPTLNGTTDLGFDTVLEMKTAVTLVIAVLVLGQLVGALWMYGKLGRPAPRWLGTAHRAAGALTLLLTLFVAYSCLWSLGLEIGHLHSGEEVPVRTVVHGFAGCAVLGTVVVKIVAVRSRRSPGWFLPVAGGLLFSLFVLVILTSAVWYVDAKGWPTLAAR